MNTPGHFWCDQCDEPAFGAACETCHAPARWVRHEPGHHSPVTYHVPPAEWFARLHAAVDAAPSFIQRKP